MQPDHTHHAVALAAVKRQPVGLAGHAWLETFSVLTRVPPPSRRPPAEVVAALATNFPQTRWLPESMAQSLAKDLAQLGIAGGAVYDALVGATAVAHGLPLLTRDERALPVYRTIGTQAMLIR
jgi:predicted nucleic acid-binding protein